MPRTVDDLKEALQTLQDARDRQVYSLATPLGLRDDKALITLAVTQSAIMAFEAVISSGRPEPEPFLPESSTGEAEGPDKGHLLEVEYPPEA